MLISEPRKNHLQTTCIYILFGWPHQNVMYLMKMDAMTNVATTHQTRTVDTLDTRSAPGAEMSNIY